MAEKHSPVFPKTTVGMDFSGAIREIAVGKRVTKLEWGNEKIYGYLKNGILTLHKDDGDHTWMISEGDLAGNDWVVLSDKLETVN